MSSIKHRYRKFFLDATALIGGASAAKIIGIMLVPVVTRLYDPGDFGVVALLLSIVMVFGTIAALRYDHAIILPDNDLVSLKLVKLSFIFILITASILFLFAFLAINNFTEFSLIKNMGDWLYVVPLLVILTGAGNVLSNWCTRKTRYKLIGSSEVSVSLVLSGTRILMGGALGSSILGLILGNILGLISKIIVLMQSPFKKDLDINTADCDYGLVTVAKRYKEFPLYSAPTGVHNALFQKLPVIMLGVMFLPGVVGLYAMASRLTRLPIDIISLPIRRIYMQRISKSYNENRNIKAMLVKTTIGLFVLGLIPFMLIAIFGEVLFAFVLGEKWGQSGVYASILVPWLFSVFIITPSSSNFVVLKKQALWFRVQLYNGALGVAVFAAGYLLEMSVENILVLFSIMGACANIGVFIVAFAITMKSDAKVISN